MKKREKSLIIYAVIIVLILLALTLFFSLQKKILPSPICNINQAIQEKLSQGLNELAINEDCVLNDEIIVPENFVLDGNNAVLTANRTVESMIKMESSFGTYGNNAVKNLILNGDGMANYAIRAIGRSNLSFSNIEITRTKKSPVFISGGRNWVPFSIALGVYDECPDFNLNINFSSRDKDAVPAYRTAIYEAFKTCPDFPRYMSEIAKDIKLEKIRISDSYLNNMDVSGSNDRWYGLINIELVHNVSVSDSFLEGKNVYGIKVYSWASFSKIYNNIVNVIEEENKDISPSLGIEVWDGYPSLKIYNNTVNRWISLAHSFDSETYDNKVIFTSGKRIYGIEVWESDNSKIYRNLIKGAEVGLSIDRGNNNAVFENNTILDTTNYGMQVANCNLAVGGKCDNITIRNNIVDNVSNGNDGTLKRGIFFNHGNISNSIIESNIIKNTGGSAIYLYNTNNTLVKNNFIYCYNKYSSPPGAEDDIYLNGAENTAIENNRILECGEEICNNNTNCELGEDCLNCEDDCGVCPVIEYCGDGIKNNNEECDIQDLGLASCVSLGYGYGNLSCNLNCTLDTSLCISGISEFCGDGNCSGNETFLTCPQDCFECVQNIDCREVACPDGSFIHELCINNSCVLKAQCSNQYCGDKVCQDNEDCYSCFVDCGCKEGEKCENKKCVEISETKFPYLLIIVIFLFLILAVLIALILLKFRKIKPKQTFPRIIVKR